MMTIVNIQIKIICPKNKISYEILERKTVTFFSAEKLKKNINKNDKKNR